MFKLRTREKKIFLCDFPIPSVSTCLSYFGCLDDIPEPLREPNDDFLQLPIMPVPNGSGTPGRGGGHWGGGGRKSIQFAGAKRESETLICHRFRHGADMSETHLARSASSACSTCRPSVSSKFRTSRRHRFRARNASGSDSRTSPAASS
jgi:hypothetical protein